MAELATLARPYSRAAFEVASNEGELQFWLEALASAAAVTQDAKVKRLLAAPSLTATQKSNAIENVLGKESSGKLANFLSTLAKNNRLSLLPEIFTLFSIMKAQREKSVEVVVTSAFALDKKLENKLVKALTESLNREVKLSTEIDPSLLGGAVIRAGDTVIDGSVKGRLTKLAETMNT